MIAVTSKSFSKNNPLISELKKKFPGEEIRLQLGAKGLSQSELIRFLDGCDKAIIALEEINSSVLSQCPKLKKISKFGVGLNNIDKKACEEYKVQIGWTGGVNKLSVAEMTLGFMIGLSRNLFKTSFEMKGGQWKKDGGFQLSGKTVGIIGVGHVGKEVIRLLKPFNCEILVNDIIDQPDFYNQHGLIPSTKEEIFENSEIISVHTPLTEDTLNLFSSDNFKRCKKSPFVINTARGGIVNENDLLKAIDDEAISGAALDVFEIEPLDLDKIYKNHKIVTTPHIGGNAKEAVHAMGISAIENLT